MTDQPAEQGAKAGGIDQPTEGEKFPQNSIPRMVGGIRSLSTPVIAEEIRDFFAQHPIPQGQLTLEQHLEKMTVNVALRAREGSRIGG